jgi:hypothetical protein
MRFRNKKTGQLWIIEHQDTIDRLIADPEFEKVPEEAPVEEPKEQEAAEEAPAKPKRSRKGS